MAAKDEVTSKQSGKSSPFAKKVDAPIARSTTSGVSIGIIIPDLMLFTG